MAAGAPSEETRNPGASPRLPGPGQPTFYFPPPAEDEKAGHARRELALTRRNTANVRYQLALLYDHREEPSAATETAAGNPHAQLAAARREHARLQNKMADYQEKEGHRTDAAATRQIAAYENAAAAYDQAIAEELETSRRPKTRQTQTPPG